MAILRTVVAAHAGRRFVIAGIDTLSVPAARPGPTGQLSALSVFHSRSCGSFVWARRALNGPKRRLPARGQSTEAVRLARLYAFHGADAVRHGIGIGVH